MHSFNMADQESFPSRLGGIIVPDNGSTIHFHNVIENYYGCEDPLIALFISEFITSLEVPYLDNPDLINLAAIVTFGNAGGRKGYLGERTHIQTAAAELKIPFLRLIVPNSYPAPIRVNDAEDPYNKTWYRITR